MRIPSLCDVLEKCKKKKQRGITTNIKHKLFNETLSLFHIYRLVQKKKTKQNKKKTLKKSEWHLGHTHLFSFAIFFFSSKNEGEKEKRMKNKANFDSANAS